MSGGARDVFPTPSATNFGPDELASEGSFQRRLRHLTSVQIRNLTPFPVRDTFASALSQPATRSQFTPLGNLSDDLDVTLLRKRPRLMSTTSVNTLKNVPMEDITGISDDTSEGRGRRRAQSRVGFSGEVGLGSTSVSRIALSRSVVTNATTSTARHGRIRTTSAVSSHGLPAGSASTTSSMSTLYFDHSQRTLERVVKSRLVETFITITVPEPPLSPSPPPVNGKMRSRAESGPSASPVTPPNAPVQTIRKGGASSSVSIGKTKALSTSTPRATSRLSVTKGKSLSKTRQPSSSSIAIHTRGVSCSAPLQKSSSHQSPLSSSTEASVFPNVPNYISPIHRPSTNPLYSLDASSQSDFSEHTNLSADRLRIQLWAKVDLHLGNAKGKQKESDDSGSTSGSLRWKVLEEWIFSLSDLIPLSPKLENDPSQLLSNTLVMTFMQDGQSFYLPPPAWSRSRSQSRSPSPSGYNTDPELEGRKLIASTQATSISHEMTRNGRQLRSRKLEARSVSSEELLQLVTLQASIRDMEESLHDVINEIDLCLAKDRALILKHEASERQARLEDWQSETQAIIERSDRLRDDLAMRRVQLQTRRDCLTKAKTLQAQNMVTLSEKGVEVAGERNNLITIRNLLPPIRTSLISTLATIYPIELLSPSELLFTILAVPLPIPFNPNEPAPPLSLSSHKEVTEESVATALGYAAHLVQLLSVYTRKGLVYPITYIGSRSLIRDNISAMVGPRMFPLFSKGVDTYRFEYAVFLLNKNIEMLMADRDLRALDMRHTLPNLKNLLLTLTDGECASARNPRIRDSPSTVGLATPPRTASPPASGRTSETPTAGRSPGPSGNELPEEPNPSPSSGVTTPKAGQGEGSAGTLPRHSKLSLGFPPLSGLFRSRHSPGNVPPSGNFATDTGGGRLEGNDAVGAPSGSAETLEGERGGKGEDDDDRRTIKGVIVGTAEEKIDAGPLASVVAVDSLV